MTPPLERLPWLGQPWCKDKRMREFLGGQRSTLTNACYGGHYLEFIAKECPRKELVVRATREGGRREKRVNPLANASRGNANTSTETVGK